MNPIAQALAKYHAHLYEGGDRPNLAELYPYEEHVPEKLFSASKQMLCDRQAVYSVMEDLGEIEPDYPVEDSLMLDFRVGNLFEDYIGEAMAWKGALRGWQTRISDGKYRKGRLDLLIAPKALGVDDHLLWTVEVKTMKAKDPNLLVKFAPKPYHIAQADFYVENMERKTRPVLFYAIRTTFESAIYTWRWDDDDAVVEAWDDVFGWEYFKTLPGLRAEILESREAQNRWLEDGTMPERIGEKPESHPFMCMNRKTGEPSCPFFDRCWNGH